MWRLGGGLPCALMVRGLAAFTVLGANTFLPLAVTELRGLSLTAAGALVSVGGVTWTLGSVLQSRLEVRFGEASRVARVRAGMVAVTLGVLVTAVSALGLLPLECAYAGWLVACLGMGVGYNSNSLLMLSSVRGAAAGRLSGQMANVEVLMTAVAAGAAGALVARVVPLSTAFTAAFAVVLAASALTWIGVRRLE